MQSAAAISEHLDTRTAAIEVAALLENAMSGHVDLVFVFASFHHREALEEAIADIRQTLSPTTIIGVTTESVVGCDLELEGVAGLSAIAFNLPGTTLTTSQKTRRQLPKNQFAMQGARPDEIPNWIDRFSPSRRIFRHKGRVSDSKVFADWSTSLAHNAIQF